MSFTKGEWKAKRTRGGGYSIFGDNKLLVITLHHPRTTLLEEEANAHLIVSATDMYGALKALEYQNWILYPNELNMMKEALTKAEGKV